MASPSSGTCEGYTIFCDDIRHEHSGKQTIIGVYANVMVISGEYPVKLPSVGMYVTFIEPVGQNSDLTLKIFMPGDDETPFFEMPWDVSDKRRQALAAKPHPFRVESEPFKPIVVHNASIVLGLQDIVSDGLIRVRVAAGAEMHRLGVLTVVNEKTLRANAATAAN